MLHARLLGTAWDKTADDYAYARDLDHSGWAWEFLRRNEDYRRDSRMNRAGHPVQIRHVTGATLYRPRRRFLAAEDWGLQLFADPNNTSLNTDVLWLPQLLRHTVQCFCKPSHDNNTDSLSLQSFTGRRIVLVGVAQEYVTLIDRHLSAAMVVERGSMLFGKCKATFLHEGLETASRHADTLNVIRQLTGTAANRDAENKIPDSKYLAYLMALDGHLEGRSYRDIADILYGKERVGSHWTDDTRWMKSKVRRAVERGIALMNGGYRALL